MIKTMSRRTGDHFDFGRTPMYRSMSGVPNVVGKPRKVDHSTYVYRTTEGWSVTRYHHTDILTVYPDGAALIDTGGYFTMSTKDRLNNALAREGYPWRVVAGGGCGWEIIAFPRWDASTMFEGSRMSVPGDLNDTTMAAGVLAKLRRAA